MLYSWNGLFKSVTLISFPLFLLIECTFVQYRTKKFSNSDSVLFLALNKKQRKDVKKDLMAAAAWTRLMNLICFSIPAEKTLTCQCEQ